MTDSAEQLELAGDALQRAWRQDHLRHRRRSARFGRRRFATAVVLAALALGAGAALAASLLKTAAGEETGITEGYQLFADSNPHCVSLSASSFHCILATPPTGETFYNEDGTQALDRFLGITAETVDGNHRVDGACVAIAADGRSWNCYLGEEAVSRGLISPNLLGAYRPNPATA